MEGIQSHVEMVPTKSRSRSNTAVSAKSRKRPQSRASTTSMQSAATHSVLDQQFPDQPTDYQKHWYDNQGNGQHQQHRFDGMEHQLSPEDMVMHSASQLQNPREYGIDPALEAAVNHSSMTYHPENPYKPENSRHSLPIDGYGTSFAEDDSPLLEGRSDEQDDVDSVNGNGGHKKSGKSSAANEMEMRQLFQSNKNRTLPEVAKELHGNERGPNSERTRQVFAMLWINQVCDKGKGSVPRGRVYAQYVSRCATERVTVLNPASFGKLVRVLFPGLKTRRLGVRGESKYHYVNFSLIEDQPDLIESQAQHQLQNFNEPARFNQNAHVRSQPSADRAAFPLSEPSPVPKQAPRAPKDHAASHSLYNQPLLQGVHQPESLTDKTAQKFSFAPPSENLGHDYEPITLPKIDPYIPSGTDPDSASALTALYRSHCTSLVDAIRFVKQKTFFHLFTSFHGTLTMPVQKLFAHPSIAPWIEECDFLMYQKMMHVVAHLTLEVVPQAILDILQEISARLVPHIQSAFNGQPAHVIQAKVSPATLFAGLLDRMCRVNLTAHACANMLSHPPNRDQMYEDFITMVRLRKVAESVPTRAMDDVVALLLTELRDLLDPVAVPWEVEAGTPYGEMALRNGRQQQTNIHADSTTENVLDRWVNFLTSLPGRFPYASPANIVACVQTVGTAVMRDLTIRSGQSFGAWWVTKCWIDEMISFMAEKGGFMDYKTTRIVGYETTGQSNPNGTANQPETQYSSAMETFAHNPRSTSPLKYPVSVPGPMETRSQVDMNAAPNYDDSGIGMRSPEDDFSMSKFGFNDAQTRAPHSEGATRV